METLVEGKLKQCQDYHYTQSSKVSALGRNIIYGEIGTMWVVMYSNHVYHNPCIMVVIALGLCFIYLLIDITHYYIDSYCYRREYFILDESRNVEGILDKHSEFMYFVARCSFCMLNIKFVGVLIISIIFIIAFLRQFEII